MNHGAAQGLCAPAIHEEEVIELREQVKALEVRLTPWYTRVVRWFKEKFNG